MKLESLVVNNSDITDDDVRQLVTEHPLTGTLDLDGCRQLTTASAELLADTPHITEMHVAFPGWTEELRARAGSRIVQKKVW